MYDAVTKTTPVLAPHKYEDLIAAIAKILHVATDEAGSPYGRIACIEVIAGTALEQLYRERRQ
jgi:hypothetical protein